MTPRSMASRPVSRGFRAPRTISLLASAGVALGMFLALGGNPMALFQKDADTLAAPPDNPSVLVDATCNGTQSVIDVTWNSTGGTSYNVLRDGAVIASVSGTSYRDAAVTAGTRYSYNVQACNSDGCNPGVSQTVTATALACATPNQPPVCVSLTASPSSGQAPLAVTFTASVFDPDGDSLTILYSFGDGAQSTGGTSIAHTYTIGGTFTARATVDDGRGGIAICETTVSVTAPSQPPTVPPGNPPENPSVLVNAECIDTTSVIRVSWNAVSGATSYRVLRNGAEIAAVSGTEYVDWSVTVGTTYSYNVRSCNASGCNPGVSQTVTATAIECAITPPPTFPPPTFPPPTTPPPLPPPPPPPPTLPPPPVNRPPVCQVVTATPNSGQAPLTVNFMAQASDPDGDLLYYVYNFGDGTGTQPGGAWATHTYTSVGTFNVLVTVGDPGGLTATCATVVTVTQQPPPQNQPPVCPSVTATPSSGQAPLTSTFTANASDPDGDPLTYSWSFTDGGSAGNQRTVSRTFTSVGTHRAIATVTDGRGGSVTCEGLVTVTAQPPQYQPPVCPSVTVSPTIADVNQTVSFTANASSPQNLALTYSWTFSNGATAGNQRTVSRSFPTPGTYTAAATVSDGQTQVICSAAVTIRGLQVTGEELLRLTKESNPTVLRNGEITTVTLTIRNIGDGDADRVTVTDTISGTRTVHGRNGGRLEYVSGSMTVSGARSTGSIEQSGGVVLRDIDANDSVTIRYQLRAVTTGMAASASSVAENTAVLSTGQRASSTVTILAAAAPLPPTAQPPRVPGQPVYVPPPPITSKTGPWQVLGMVLGAMGMGGAGTLGLRRRYGQQG